jgi:acyl dehydratase
MKPDLYLEDMVVGDVWEGAPITISQDDIVAFGNAYDPQPFHTDAEAARSSPFGSLIASGWHLLAITMRNFVDTKPYGDTPVIGLGVDKLRWNAPVRPGDQLSVKREITEVVPSRSRPDRGNVTSHVIVTNQKGIEVMHFDVLTRIPARPIPRADA